MNLPILKAIFACMEQGVVFIDDRNRIAYCNPAAEKIRKIKLDEVLGRSILECHPFRAYEKVIKIIDDLKSGRVRGHHLMNIQMVEDKFYDNAYSAVRDPNNIYLGIIVVTQEVTQRKHIEDNLKEALKKLETANEELRRLNQMKDDFLSTVSHELNPYDIGHGIHRIDSQGEGWIVD
ncbi:MAG: PAS domain-containing protein [Desulfobacterales bacterium]|nr:PAS domain-containing protein [Desulfobacterales bacterium]